MTDLIKLIQDALGTTEEGYALVEVASNAHRAEMAMAQAKVHLVLIGGEVYKVFRTKEAAMDFYYKHSHGTVAVEVQTFALED